ncbi:MAG TPA: hypothetical protein PKD45_11055 [Flavobacteriales bacterium]|nr:hypothetical protein [Flavobacteriales bacterium]
MLNRRYLLLAALLVAAMMPTDLWAQGCSMCKAVAENPGSDNVFGGTQAVGAGLNKGILFIMTVPYILLFLLLRKKILPFIKEFRNAQG